MFQNSEKRWLRICLGIALFCLGSAGGHAESNLRFESGCRSLAEWEFLDLKSGGKVLVDNDSTVTNGYGPEVIDLRGEEVLLLAKGLRMKEGTICVLWKDLDPEEYDSDGVLVFGADYPDDLTVARNTRDRRAHYLVEQDSDRGFQIKFQKPGRDAMPVAEEVGMGLTDDDSWNRSGWIWQKVQLGGGKIRAKYWSACGPEPAEWFLECDNADPVSGRVGLKVWTGEAHIAYFAASDKDIVIPPPRLDLALTRNLFVIDRPAGSPSDMEFRLFLNLEGLPGESIGVRGVLAPESGGSEHPFVLRDLRSGEFSLADESPEFAAALEKVSTRTGRVELNLRLVSGKPGNESTLSAVTRTFELRTWDHYENRFRELESRAMRISATEKDLLSESALEATAALNLLRLARRAWDKSEFELLERVLGYVENSLDPNRTLCHYRFGKVDLPALNLVMGATYSIRVPWVSLGIRRTQTLTAVLEITDDLKVETPIRIERRIAPSDWKNGETATLFEFQVPHEFPPGSTDPIHRPAIREGFHRFFLSLRDESGQFLWLDNPGADHAGHFAQRHEVGRLYVTPQPIAVTGLRLVPKGRPNDFACLLDLTHRGDTSLETRVILELETDAGFSSAGARAEVSLAPHRRTQVSFDAGTPRIAGELVAKIRFELPDGTFSYAEKKVTLPEPVSVVARKTNRVTGSEGEFRSEVSLSLPEDTPLTGPLSVEAYLDDFLQETLEWDPSEQPELSIDLEPGVGWYTFLIHPQGSPAVERRVIAPVWETREGRLYLNGEPFYVKGVNGHALIGQSPERTRLVMRLLKRMGFNTIRGDYPPDWELDVAQEENLGWMVLAPFSVTNTDILKERNEPYPLRRMREKTRRFIPHYVNHPSMWLWNDFNEVTGETDILLAMFYPIYKAMDPYDRPVVYANLIGQDRFLDQDVMGINYYYRPGTELEEIRDRIHQSQKLAENAEIPVIYTEYNNWFGPVYSEGARAVREMFAAELSPNHPGGFFYQLRENIDRHPGVITDDRTVWVNPTLEQAFRDAFADLEISETPSPEGIVLKNKRPFTLRKMTYRILEGPLERDKGQLPDLLPEETVAIPVRQDLLEGTFRLDVVVRFETHYGIRNEVSGSVYP